MADTAALDAAWKALGRSGDRPAGWFGEGGSPDNPVTSTGQNLYNQQSSQMNAQRDAALKSATSTFEASIPEIQQRYGNERTRLASQIQPLQDRYSNLINEIKGRETTSLNNQSKITSNEFSRRGIPLSSTNFQQELEGNLGGIRQQYGTQIKDIGFQQESDIRSIQDAISRLTDQETGAIRDVRNQIGGLQYQSGMQGIQDALNLFTQQRGYEQQQFQNDLAQRQFAEAQRQAQLEEGYRSQTFPIELALSQLQLQKARTAGNQYANESSSLQNIFGGNPVEDVTYSPGNEVFNPSDSSRSSFNYDPNRNLNNYITGR